MNGIYIRTRTSVRLSDAARSWREQVIVHIRQDVTSKGQRLDLPSGNLGFILDAYPPTHRTSDPDNLLKLSLDSVMAAFGTNDTRVKHVESTVHPPSTDNPRLLVRLEPWPKEGTNGQEP